MKASVIILTWNGMTYLEACLNAVLAQVYPDFEVIVVDNASTDGSAELVAEQYPQVRLMRNERNLGFAAGNNVGLRAATGNVLVLLNQDTEVRPGWLAALVEAVQNPTVGIVGCKLLYPDGTIQHAGAYLDEVRGASEHYGRHEPDTGQYDTPREVEFVTGAAVALTRATLSRVGELDEGFAPAYYEDVDWCYRVREAGLRVWYCPQAAAVHYESTSIQDINHAHRATAHYGRLRLLFKHHPLSWLRDTLVPAETVAAHDEVRTPDIMALRDAYMRLILSMPEIITFRRQLFDLGAANFQAEWQALVGVALRLRDACADEFLHRGLYEQIDDLEARAVGTHILAPGAQVDGARVNVVPPESPIPEVWDKAQRARQINEQPFRSEVPVFGKLIAGFRRMWNNVATRWYVMPMVRQQNEFNTTVVQILNSLKAQLAEHRVSLGLLNGSRNEMAVTQVYILHTLRRVVALSEEHRREAAQDIREIDILLQTLVEVQQRLEELEKIVMKRV
ncbi:MAG TPA: glycosyltransferase family 2 protein [Anaerolineae bacterium]|nr:glycosyltransferase family 2 protein [Anaerolineae bacterium]